MGEQNRVPALRSIMPAGTSFYLLDVKSTAGVSDSIPLQLLVSEVEQGSAQYVVPLLPLLASQEPNTGGNCSRGTIASNCIIKEETQRINPEQQSNVNILKNQVITLDPLTKINPSASNANKELNKSQAEQQQSSPKDIIQVCERKQAELKILQNKAESTFIIQNYVHIPDRVVPPRAVAVLPTALRLRRDCVYPLKTLPARVRFGPVQGVTNKIFPIEAVELVYECAVKEKPIFLLNRDEESVTHINVADKERSNWFSLLPLGNKNTANVWLYEEDNNIYGLTTKPIHSRTPLCLGYSKKYAEEHGLSPEQPVLDLEEALADQPKWWCFECKRSLGSDILLLRHMNVYHKGDTRSRRKYYRCLNCCRNFCKLFTLRRHMKFCKKKPTKTIPNTLQSEQKIPNSRKEPDFSTAENTEDTRIPSDESFQNYTSVLDFSTNLFDTDRISSLDIPSSFKSDPEFDLNSENYTSNEDYSKFSQGLKFGYDNDDKSNVKMEEHPNVTCPYCKKTVAYSAKRRHTRECPARRLECECGKLFTRKEEFANHVYVYHNSAQTDNKNTNEIVESLPYKCGDCKLKFKRRGMFVNHLWRIHNTSSASVPLERRVKHYPCTCCAKIYRTAAKRDVHIKNHHPGTSIRAAPIEGERRVYQPAKCSACPREYVTHSKLLQHIRALHPDLAEPVGKTSSKPIGRLKAESCSKK